MEPADVVALFLQKGKGLKALLCADDYAALAGVEGDLLELANAAPARPLCADSYRYVPRGWTEEMGPAPVTTERDARHENLKRIAAAAVTCALFAGAYDAVEWALTSGALPVTLERVFQHNGYCVVEDLPLAAYGELSKRGLLTADFPSRAADYNCYWGGSLSLMLKGRAQRESPEALARVLPIAAVDPQELIAQFTLGSPFAEVVYRAYNDFDPADFVRYFLQAHIVHTLDGLRARTYRTYDWAAEYVDELTYWMILRDAMTELIDRDLAEHPVPLFIQSMPRYEFGTTDERAQISTKWITNESIPKYREICALAASIVRPMPKNAAA